MIVPVHTPDAPDPAGHYAQALVHNGLVHVSLQLAFLPGVGKILMPGDAGAQAAQVLTNIDAVLRAGGSSLAHTLRLMVYMVDGADGPAIEAACVKAFGDHRPARGRIVVAGLPYGARVGMDAIGATF